MQSNRQSIIAERIEAQTKIDALENFIHGPTFYSYDVDEQERVKRQLRILEELESVLSERIRYFLEEAA